MSKTYIMDRVRETTSRKNASNLPDWDVAMLDLRDHLNKAYIAYKKTRNPQAFGLEETKTENIAPKASKMPVEKPQGVPVHLARFNLSIAKIAVQQGQIEDFNSIYQGIRKAGMLREYESYMRHEPFLRSLNRVHHFLSNAGSDDQDLIPLVQAFEFVLLLCKHYDIDITLHVDAAESVRRKERLPADYRKVKFTTHQTKRESVTT